MQEQKLTYKEIDGVLFQVQEVFMKDVDADKMVCVDRKEVVVPKDSLVQIKNDLETQKADLEVQATKTKSQIVANLSKVTEFIASKEVETVDSPSPEEATG